MHARLGACTAHSCCVLNAACCRLTVLLRYSAWCRAQSCRRRGQRIQWMRWPPSPGPGQAVHRLWLRSNRVVVTVASIRRAPCVLCEYSDDDLSCGGQFLQCLSVWWNALEVRFWPLPSRGSQSSCLVGLAWQAWTLWGRSLAWPGSRESSRPGQARAISFRDRRMELGHDSSAGAERCSAVSCFCRNG